MKENETAVIAALDSQYPDNERVNTTHKMLKAGA